MSQTAFDFVGKTIQEVEDVVHPDFLGMFKSTRYSEEYEVQKEKLRKYVETHGGSGFLVGDPTYLINRPHRDYCSRHRKFCGDVMTFEVARGSDFSRIRHAGMCWRAREEVEAEGRLIRKWQPSPSVLYRGEENLLYDDFCYYHMTREGRRIQSVLWSVDIVNSQNVAPMCEVGMADLAEQGCYVALYEDEI